MLGPSSDNRLDTRINIQSLSDASPSPTSSISSISSASSASPTHRIINDPHRRKRKLVRCGGILINESLTHIVGVMNYESIDDKKWGLPKGHLKHNESIQQCAVREIYEETGIRVKITEDTPFKKLNDTFYYIFVLRDDTVFHIRDHHEIAKVEWLAIDSLNMFNMNRGLRKFYDRFDKIKYLIPSTNAFNSES